MPRNCDVGTPEEQHERFGKFCSRHSLYDINGAHCSERCPLYDKGDSIALCALTWAQRPYDGGAGKAKKRKTSKTTKPGKTMQSPKGKGV